MCSWAERRPDLRSLLHLILANQILKCSNWQGSVSLREERAAFRSRCEPWCHCDVFSRPSVASSFDFNKSNFEVLELTIGCHIESSGRRSVRDAKPNVIATCTYARVLDYARTDSETSRTDRDCRHWAQWNSDDNLNEIATARSRSAVTERSRNVLNLVV
jgi:hypothetical protein